MSHFPQLTVEQAMSRAKKAAEQGNVPVALQLYNAVLKVQPKHADANHSLGVLALGMNKVEQALPFFKTALEANAANGQYWVSFINAIIIAGNYDAAANILKQGKMKGLTGDAVDQLAARIEAGKLNIQHNQKIEPALNFKEEGCYKESLIWLKDWVLKHPDDANALAHLAQINLLLEREKDARKAIDKALLIAPNLPIVQRNLARLFLKQQKIKHALSAASKAFQMEPQNHENRLVIASTLAASGQDAKAMELVDGLIQDKHDYAEAYATRALLKLRIADQKGALADCKQALDIKPHLTQIWILSASLYHQSNNLTQAINCLEQALLQEPDNVLHMITLGEYKRLAGDTDAALALLKKAVEIAPDNASAWTNYGVSLQQTQRTSEAKEAYTKALDINPDIIEVLNNLGTLAIDNGDFEEATKHFSRVIRFKPDLAQAYSNMGIALRAQGKLDKALQSLHTAFEKEPENLQVTETFINTLNFHLPSSGTCGSYAIAQEALQLVTPKYTNTTVIADETVQQLYMECDTILMSHGLDTTNYLKTQIYRGIVGNLDCDRYRKVFDKHNIIPESCFDCYKVSITPRTVVELFKLMLVFNDIKLPRDNTRKCLVEVRPDIKGAYTGLIYCQDAAEGKVILNIVRTAIGKKISNNIPVSLKRGCSEYRIAYPEFDHRESSGKFQMAYNKKWRKYESDIDKNLTGINPQWSHTYNHSGLTLRDALILRTWLSYAATNGDLSYLKISKSPIDHFNLLYRD